MSDAAGAKSVVTDLVKRPAGGVIRFVDDALRHREPWKIVFTACGVTFVLVRVCDRLRPFDG
jgi:hypothetical protein